MSLAPITAADVRKFRASIGVSQTGLAELLGVSMRAVQQWEAGQREAPAYLRLAFAAINMNVPAWVAE